MHAHRIVLRCLPIGAHGIICSSGMMGFGTCDDVHDGKLSGVEEAAPIEETGPEQAVE